MPAASQARLKPLKIGDIVSVAVWRFGEDYARGRVEDENDWESEEMRDEGVVVGKDSDVGGGASIMGTLSGGGNIVNSMGKNCLLGANAGIGIPLGDRCTVEAGLYITAGTKVTVKDENGEVVGAMKARELAGQSDLLFRRNSVNGMVECLANRSEITLNEELHAHN